mgnify:CR=1 FL=1|tara:strand:+ start:8 stop:544 length:537 start_codon:yes stop_codon:yes gene_type:complete
MNIPDSFEQENTLNTNFNHNNISNKNWAIKKNVNAVFSKLNRDDKCFIGNYITLDDLLTDLEDKKDIIVFIWHNQELQYQPWRGKAYGLTFKDLKEKDIENNNLWKEETNVISGIKVMNYDALAKQRTLNEILCKNYICKQLTINNILNSILVLSKISFTLLVFSTSYITLSKDIFPK